MTYLRASYNLIDCNLTVYSFPFYIHFFFEEIKIGYINNDDEKLFCTRCTKGATPELNSHTKNLQEWGRSIPK